jgi:UPF0271 protein
VGPAAGQLASAATIAGLGYAREGFADRGTRADGSLLPRGEPGALLTDPAAAAQRARELATRGGIDTICVHGDTPGAVAIARAVRDALDALALEPMGDAAWRARLPPGADRRAVLHELRAVPRVVDAVVCEELALVTFEPGQAPDGALVREAIARSEHATVDAESPPALHVVRVRYDGQDLVEIARRLGTSAAHVAALHAAPVYVVAAIGFQPGFGYLRGLDSKLVLPRRDTPRTRVPALAVGIAGPYTGVYPIASPGGWHLLGTAVGFRPFDPARGSALALGDRVRFEPEGT